MTENKRDSFIFYRSFFDVIQLLNGEQAKSLMIAIGEFALDGTEPDLKENTLKVAWLPIRPQLEANRRRYENGRKGGAPKGSYNNPNGRRGKQLKTEQEPTEILPFPPLKVAPIIQPACLGHPTKEEVKQLVEKENLRINSDDFYFYYESRGWQVGNTPISNWKALAQTWHNRELKKEADNSSPMGIGERIDDHGHRTYANGETIVPSSAPPRPSASHWWNAISQQWEKCA